MEGNVRLYRAKIEAGEMTEEEATAILGKSPFEAQGKIPAVWPTPTTQEVEHPNAEWYLEKTRLRRRSKTYITRRYTGHRDSQLPSAIAQDDPSLTGGRLNPTWVEWLMGFPTGWTDLEDSETPSSPKSPKSSADS